MDGSEGTELQHEKALRLLKELFAGRQRVFVSEVMRVADANAISRSTFARVRKELAIRPIRNGGKPGLWEATTPLAD